MKRPATLQGTILRKTTQRRAPIPGLKTLRWAPLWTGLLVVCLSMAPACSQLTPEDEERLLQLHNHHRGQVEPSAADMLALRWDEKLRILAESYAVKCLWNHNPDLQEMNTGENLYVTESSLDLELALKDWFLEHESYDFETLVCEEGKMCGHYTQMVWAQSSAVGCASHLCDTMEGLEFKKSTFLVCNYFPAGNYPDVLPYEEGPPCSKCSGNAPGCLDSLCVPDAEPTDEPIPWEEPTSESPDSDSAESSNPPDEPGLGTTSCTGPTSGPGPTYGPGPTSGPQPTQEDREPTGTESTEGEEERGKERAQERDDLEKDMSSAGTSSKPAFVIIGIVVLLSLGL